ncbi:HesB/IscA family protein [Sediminitomix flava]|uniref:Iron-sulfur cluster assembly protein n=1 Tax=Sediminitomix flava TaxID=379075 RepID=A0A315Z7U9_SEDFL|nr:iron-sulfur cluster assembly accessory protein [Sediminitomix flava]PWJ40121.1 iron-sulfur cluster assembly protein [Sediminitomix flava]
MKLLPLSITDKASKEIQDIMQNKSIPEDYQFRVGMRGSGCGGAGFFIGFDTKKDDDEIYEINSIKVLVDKKHLMYLLDLEIDFEERVDERGFIFNKK